MVSSLMPDGLAGEFFGVGSLPENKLENAIPYIQKLPIPYAFQLTSVREEDMIRQFAYLIDGFEDDEDFVLELDMYTYQDVVSDDSPLVPDQVHSSSLYKLIDGADYQYFKTQQTAPATMCFSTRGPDGKQLVSEQMFQMYSSLMKRVANGQTQHLENTCDTVIICQDDPALGFVMEIVEQGRAGGLSLKNIIRETNNILPNSVIPAYHYCDDWRDLHRDDWYLLWDERPKIVHIDIVRYPPILDREQSERVNRFLERGGGLALGLLPNTDDAYNAPVIETFQKNVESALTDLQKSGVQIEMLKENFLVSTQCGLSRASIGLAREIHEAARKFRHLSNEILEDFE